jgi:hypothetical protein
MKSIIAMMIGALLFGGGLIEGLSMQGSVMNNYQPTATTYEGLAVEDYVSKPFTRFGIQFSLKNEGSTNLQIVEIMINGFLNQSSSGSMIGWNGTTFFYPNQGGFIWVYYPAYAQAIKSTMPSISTQTTLEEKLESLESWMNSFNSTFTFITNTKNRYNYTIPRLGYDMFTALYSYYKYGKRVQLYDGAR